MVNYVRAHPVTIVFNLGRVLYLIIIPVLRGFVTALQGGFAKWLSGAWMDVLVFLFMVGVAALYWAAVKLDFNGERLYIRYGLVNIRETSISWDNVTTVSLLEPFYLRPLRAVRFRADTLGGSFRKSDFTIILSEKHAHAITASRNPLAGKLLGQVYQPSTASIIYLSLLTSNSFGGIIFISAFISQSGKILGGEFSGRIIGTFEQVSRALAFGLPPAAAAIGYALLAGWFIGFLLTFVRYKNFTLTRHENVLAISGGIFTRRGYDILYRDINFIDIRQSIVTKLLRLSSLYLSAVGYGKQKDDISCIIPTANEEIFERGRHNIFPAFIPAPRTYAPTSRGIMRFLGQPLSGLAGIGLSLFIFLRIFPEWGGFIRFVGIMAFVPAALFLVIRFIEYKTGGLAFDGCNYTMRYSSGLTLHTVVIPKDKIVRVELNQGFMQKFGPYCDLVVGTKAEGRFLHRCRSLLKSDLAELFDLRIY